VLNNVPSKDRAAMSACADYLPFDASQTRVNDFEDQQDCQSEVIYLATVNKNQKAALSGQLPQDDSLQAQDLSLGADAEEKNIVKQNISENDSSLISTSDSKIDVLGLVSSDKQNSTHIASKRKTENFVDEACKKQKIDSDD